MIRLKNEKQINGIRKSCQLLAEMYKHVIPLVQAGMSTYEIDELCREFIVRHGGKPAWYAEDFPGAACISVNDEVIHGIPSRKVVLKEGDIIETEEMIPTWFDLDKIPFDKMLQDDLLWYEYFLADKKFIGKVKFKDLNIWPHFKETLVYFIPTVATSIYQVLDKTLIGLITKDPYQNGFYEPKW